ncbi:MAG: O-antigen ligase family protein [Pseudomonadota bacterium]
MQLPIVASTFTLLIASVLAGIAVVIYVPFVGDNLFLISALPFVLALSMLLVFDKRKLFMLILLFRASGDIFLESSKFSTGVGVGGLINALIILIAMLFVLERPSGITRLIISIWGGVLLVALIASAHTPVPADAIRMFLAMVSNFAVFVIAFYLVKSRADFQLFLGIVVLSSVLPVLYSFVDIALNSHVTSPDGFRLKSTFSHANIFAFYLVFIISLVFYQIKSDLVALTQARRIGLALYLLLLIALLLLTKTRSAWAGCFVVFVVYGVLFERRYLLYLLLVPLAGLLIPSVRDRLLDLNSGNEYVQYAKLNSYAWRKLLWKTSLEWMKPLNSIMGYGLDSFRYYSPQFFPLAGKMNVGAHSTYVQWFFETGIVGVTAAAWMYCRMLYTLWLGRTEDRLGTAIIITLVVEYLVFAYSDNMQYYLSFNWYFWFVMGAGCALTMARLAQVQAEPPRKLAATSPEMALQRQTP